MNEVLLFTATLLKDGELKPVDVYLMADASGALFYRAVIDKIQMRDLIMTEEMVWRDIDNGETELAEVLGKLIESKTE